MRDAGSAGSKLARVLAEGLIAVWEQPTQH